MGGKYINDMNIEDLIIKQINDSVSVKTKVLADEALRDKIKQAALFLVDAYKSCRKVLLAGNGGSAADAQHLAGEFVSRFYFDRPGLPAIALTTDTSIMTAIGNDYGFDRLFERQAQAQGVPGDVFLGISTSGNAANIHYALVAARAKGMKVIGLTGKDGGKLGKYADTAIIVPEQETYKIQELHLPVYHTLCLMLEDCFF